MRFFRAAALLTLCLGLVAAASACGGASTAAGSGAAVYAPASAAIFATVDTDTGGDQWQALDALLAKFPDGKGTIDKALSELGGEEGLDFEDDIQPAVGAEVAIVGFDTEGDDVVFLTQPADPEALKKLVATSDDPGVTEELDDGWWAAGSQKSLDRFNDARKSGDSLADDGAYQDATADLMDNSIATLYANGRAAGEAEVVPGLGGAQGALAKCFGGDDAANASLALAARIEDDGVRIQGDVASSVIPAGDGDGASLDQFFRSGALAYVATSGLGDTIRELVECATADDSDTAQMLAQIQLGLGLSIDDDVAGLFDGATGVAVYAPASDVGYTDLSPVVVVATEVDDEDEAMGLIEKLVDRAGGLMGLMGGESSITLQDAGIEGLNARALMNDGKPVLYIGATDGKLVASNSETGLAALGEGSSLAEDPVYAAGREAAGVPDDAAALAYVNIAGAMGLVHGLLPGGWTPYGPGADDPAKNLEPLKSLFLWSGEPDGGSVSFEGFLQIQ